MARVCIFCDGLPLTKEHGWPGWIDKYLPPRTVKQTLIRDDFVPRAQGQREQVSGAEIRKVCETCNNRWMSDLENEAMPIIGPMMQGCGTTLDQAAQQLIATWVVKTYLVHASSGPIGERLRPQCRYMYEHRRPMPNHRVLIGAFGVSRWVTVCHVQPLTLADNEGRAASIDAHVATLAVGHFVGQAWFLPPEVNIEPVASPKPRLRLVWPCGETFIWPSGPFLNDEQLQQIAQTNLPVYPGETLPDSSAPWPKE